MSPAALPADPAGGAGDGGKRAGGGDIRGAVTDWLALALVVGAAAGALTGNALGAAACAAVLAILGLSRLWASLALRDIACRLVPSTRRLVEGEALTLTMTLENGKPLMVPWLEIEAELPAGLESPALENRQLLFGGALRLRERTGLGQYERLTFRYTLTAARRGRYRLGPTRLRSGDPFGFYNVACRVPDTGPGAGAEVVVYPRTIALPHLRLPAARPMGDGRNRFALVTDPTQPDGLREYRPTDPARSIDWKATARLGEPTVRTYSPSAMRCIVVFLECRTAAEGEHRIQPEVLEAAVSAAASVVLHAHAAGFQVGLVANGLSRRDAIIGPGLGPAALQRLMTALSAAHAMPASTLEAVAARWPMPFGATVAYVAGTLQPATAAYMRGLARRGHVLVTAYTGIATPPADPRLNLQDWRPLFPTLAVSSDG